MPGESREPFLVICQARTTTVEHTPHRNTESGLPDFHLPVLKDVGNSNGNIACECV
jgi:hypothetical protein